MILTKNIELPVMIYTAVSAKSYLARKVQSRLNRWRQQLGGTEGAHTPVTMLVSKSGGVLTTRRRRGKRKYEIYVETQCQTGEGRLDQTAFRCKRY